MANKNPQNAISMQKYMKDQFIFFGIQSPLRKELERPFLKKDELPEFRGLKAIIRELWQKEEREYQYFAIELLKKFKRKFNEPFLGLYEQMITQKSWWDTVDLIASTLVGELLQRFPEMASSKTNLWIRPDNIWLQRTAILFQLKYKDQTDFELLKALIQQTAHSQEFFIQKAIGWALREYSKHDPKAVKNFLDTQTLAKLSVREVSKYLT